MSSTSAPLAGRVALVTGGTRGIGLAIARALSADGAYVALTSASGEGGDAAVASLAGEGEAIRCDVADADAVDAMVRDLAARKGGLAIVVSNAGIALDALVMRTTREIWERTIAVNLTGAFNVTKAAMRPLLRARGYGRIVYVSSVIGEQGNAGQAAYAATKSGLLGLARSTAREVARRGITVNVVSPGFIETRMTDASVTGDRREALLAQIPLGRIGAPEDVAEAVRYLCSPGAGYVTGQVLRVNGGLYM